MKLFKNIFRGRMAGTSQLVAQAGRDQVENSARGYVYALDPMDRVDRFLILGSEGGTYYATERALTQDNALHLAEMVRTNGTAVVHRIVAICAAGRSMIWRSIQSSASPVRSNEPRASQAWSVLDLRT